MNVLFHITAAVGVAVMLTDTDKIKPGNTLVQNSRTMLSVFAGGIISHGAIDYIPHCYPVNSKADIVCGFILICTLLFLTRTGFRMITGLAIFGGILPDLIDLGPAMMNGILNTNLPVFPKIFPWHWKVYSGSVYTGNCNVSTFNHFLLLLMVAFICLLRKKDFLSIFRFN